MAYFNNKQILLAGLKGDSAHIRYSAYEDGTDFTETWSEGQNYIGFATGQAAPTDKSAYTWALLPKGDKGDTGEAGKAGEDGESVEIVQTTGDSETAVMSQKVVTDQILVRDPMVGVVEGIGYWHKDGYINTYPGYNYKRTLKIPCVEGDVFVYYGLSDEDVVASWTFYDDADTLVSYGAYNAYAKGEIEVVIPSGVTGVIFSSYASVGKGVPFSVYKVGTYDYEIQRLKTTVKNQEEILDKCALVSSMLDTVAYGGKTYREIFEHGNLIPDGDFENGLDFITKNTNGAEITDEACFTSSHSLKCFGASSVQIQTKVTVVSDNTYYEACKARVDRYASGGGAGIYDDSSGGKLSKHASGKFETIGITYVPSAVSVTVTIGTVSAADCDAYIDDVVLVDLSALFGDTIPSVEEMNDLYDKYLDIKINWEKNVQADASEEIPITVDTPAYAGISYKTIFETSNLLVGGDFETSTLLDSATLTGTPTITDAVSCTGSKSLMCSGDSNQYIRVNKALTAGDYFIAAMVKWESRTSGNITIETASGGAYFKEIKDDFTPMVHEMSLSEDASRNILFGVVGKGTAYMDDIVLIKKDDVFAGKPLPPSYAIILMYMTYIDIKRGKRTSNDRVVYRNTAVEAFLNAMRAKATDIGITDIGSNLMPASGASMSANEMLALGLEACSYSDLCRIWNKNSYTYVTGSLREVTLTSTVQNETFEADYTILGGKTGSGNSGDPSYLLIVGENKHGTRYIGAVCKCINEVGVDHRWEAMKALFDIATAIEEDPQYDTTTSTVPYATGAAICKLPPCNTALLQGRVDVIFAQNADEKSSSIQSVTKTLNACTALEWMKDLETIVEVTSEDVTENDPVKAGDVVTLRELFHAMMLPSSNVAASVIARVVGEKIVNNYCDKYGIT